MSDRKDYINWVAMLDSIANGNIESTAHYAARHVERLEAENKRLAGALDDLEVHALRDIAEGFVSVSSVEWDSVFAHNQPPIGCMGRGSDEQLRLRTLRNHAD